MRYIISTKYYPIKSCMSSCEGDQGIGVFLNRYMSSSSELFPIRAPTFNGKLLKIIKFQRTNTIKNLHFLFKFFWRLFLRLDNHEQRYLLFFFHRAFTYTPILNKSHSVLFIFFLFSVTRRKTHVRYIILTKYISYRVPYVITRGC